MTARVPRAVQQYYDAARQLEHSFTSAVQQGLHRASQSARHAFAQRIQAQCTQADRAYAAAAQSLRGGPLKKLKSDHTKLGQRINRLFQTMQQQLASVRAPSSASRPTSSHATAPRATHTPARGSARAVTGHRASTSSPMDLALQNLHFALQQRRSPEECFRLFSTLDRRIQYRIYEMLCQNYNAEAPFDVVAEGIDHFLADPQRLIAPIRANGRSTTIINTVRSEVQGAHAETRAAVSRHPAPHSTRASSARHTPAHSTPLASHRAPSGFAPSERQKIAAVYNALLSGRNFDEAFARLDPRLQQRAFLLICQYFGDPSTEPTPTYGAHLLRQNRTRLIDTQVTPGGKTIIQMLYDVVPPAPSSTRHGPSTQARATATHSTARGQSSDIPRSAPARHAPARTQRRSDTHAVRTPTYSTGRRSAAPAADEGSDDEYVLPARPSARARTGATTRTTAPTRRATTEEFLAFYRDGAPNIDGVTFEELMSWRGKYLENTRHPSLPRNLSHRYIQWLFPNRKESRFNKQAALLDARIIQAFQTDTTMQANVWRAINHIAEFWGFTYDQDSGTFNPIRGHHFHWLTSGNHNFDRMSRFLKFLHAIGLQPVAQAFLDALEDRAATPKGRQVISDGTLGHWRRAAAGTET